MFTLNCKGRLLDLAQPLVMGIVNITPDSFYAGSRVQEHDEILYKVEQQLREGAAIIDLGAQSTRPGSSVLPAETEIARLVPALDAISSRFPDAVISVDTYYADVASVAVQHGAAMINDISAGIIDAAMLETIGRLGVPFCCMHMRGTPQTMTDDLHYDDLPGEITGYFVARLAACRAAGIHDVLIDPGFGFSKGAEQNFQLLKCLSVFKIFEVPLLVGLSRKSTIQKTLGVTAAEALNGTTALNMIALLNGADILRVHDVKAAVEAVKLYVSYREA